MLRLLWWNTSHLLPLSSWLPAPTVAHTAPGTTRTTPTVAYAAPVYSMTAPTVEYAPAGSVAGPAHVVEAVTPVPAAPAAVPAPVDPRVSLIFRLGMHGKRYRVTARRSQPLRSAFQRFCTRLGLQASQVRFFLDGLIISPFDTPDRIELVDGDLLEGQMVLEESDEEEDEDEDEDEDSDEVVGDLSRFPAGFLPMRMCRWFPSGNCRQGWGVHVRSP